MSLAQASDSNNDDEDHKDSSNDEDRKDGSNSKGGGGIDTSFSSRPLPENSFPCFSQLRKVKREEDEEDKESVQSLGSMGGAATDSTGVLLVIMDLMRQKAAKKKREEERKRLEEESFDEKGTNDKRKIPEYFDSSLVYGIKNAACLST